MVEMMGNETMTMSVLDEFPESLLEALQNSQIDGDFLVDRLALVLNRSMENEKMEETYRRFRTNLFIEPPLLYILALLYSILIACGTLGNLLTICAVIRKSAMRTPRNIFIINLALSDLLLSVITMPLTFIQNVTAYWPFGPYEFLCKTISSLQAISIFVSTISITAIALDRYHVIVYPTKPSVQKVGAIFALMAIWSLAVILSAPLMIWSSLKNVTLNLTDVASEIHYCIEDWPSVYGRAYYSVFTIIIQYTVPISVVSIAYCRICKKLRYRMKPGCRSETTTTTTTAVATAGVRRYGSVRKDHARVRRTNLLLISIAIIFGISWMPLNVFNLIVDIFNPLGDDHVRERVIFAFCHLFAMSSANTNPLLYGFFNDNFRKEFRDIWISVKSFICCRKRSRDEVPGRSIRESRADREPTATVQYRKSTNSKASPPDEEGDIEHSTLITQVLPSRQK